MSGFLHRAQEWLSRKEKEQDAAENEVRALEDELLLLGNEARYQSEPAYAADVKRKADELERETRALIYEAQEPARSMLQGRCQRLLEEVERRDAVQARIAEVRTRLGEIRERFPERDAADTGESRVAS